MIRQLLKSLFEPIFNFPLAKKISVVGRKHLEKFPLVVQVETTTACNAECIMCPHSKLTRPAGHMDFNLYKKIVNECIKYQKQIKYFSPFLNGELFLTPRWQDYLDYARQKLPYVQIGIFTNGSLLDAKNINTLLDIQPDWLNVSFDGTTKEVFEGIRRKLNFEQVEANILGFVNQRKRLHRKKPRVTISIIRMEKISDGLEDFLQKWKPIVDEVTIEPYSNYGGAMPNEFIKKQTYRRKSCFRLWTNLTVLVNGDACLCCLDYDGKILLGNLKEESIIDIWQGKKLNVIRRLHLSGKFDEIPLCSGCSYGKYDMAYPIWWH